MRRLRYCVAASLDGFIAGPNDENDWIVSDPSFDFAALWAQFDTLLMGRRTYEVAIKRLPDLKNMGKRLVVVSTTLEEEPGATIVRDNIPEAVAKLKAEPGKDIWLMGGGMLFRTLLDAELVDAVEVSFMPVLLGSGVPLLPRGNRAQLHLKNCTVMPSGTALLLYSVLSPNHGPAQM
ncbi:MAG: dihydrofolate reductase family protein [Acidobacteriota bacterium]